MKKLLKSKICGSCKQCTDLLLCLFCCEQYQVEKSKTMAKNKKNKKTNKQTRTQTQMQTLAKYMSQTFFKKCKFKILFVMSDAYKLDLEIWGELRVGYIYI